MTKKITSLSIGGNTLTIPEVDGPWTKNWYDPDDGPINWTAGEHTKTYDLSNRIPKDGHRYLIELRLAANPTTNGGSMNFEITTSEETNTAVLLSWNSTFMLQQHKFFILGTDRKLYVKSRSETVAGKFLISLKKCRRLAD